MNDKGLLRIDEVDDFQNFCTLNGVGYAAGKGPYEVIRVFYDAATQVITRNSADVISTPPKLRPLLDRYRAQNNVLDDTQRLDFMLAKWRKVVAEVTPRNHEVYVEEGFMGDKTYPAVVVSNEDWANLDKAGEAAIKRQAIDLAIKNQE